MKHLHLKHLVYCIILPLLSYACAPKGFVKSNENALIHENSRMIFPEKAGNFYRIGPNIYDKSGDDISVGYNIRSASCNLTITIYVYPHFDSSIDAELNQIKDAIKYVYQENELILENDVTHSQDNLTSHGKQVLYSVTDNLNGNSIEKYSMAYLFIHGNWFYKYRVTYPKEYLSCANSEIDNLISMLKWPEY